MSSTLPKHPFGLRYIYYHVFFAIFRSIIYLLKWNSLRNLKIPDGVVRKRILVPSQEGGRSIEVDVYEPSGYDHTKPNAVIINFHGCVPGHYRSFHWLTLRCSSGYALPSLGVDHEYIATLVLKANVIVLDSDYRKAPENPFPAGLQDAMDVVNYVLAYPQTYDTSNVFLSGFSAGGALALGVAMTLGPERIKGVFGFYPPVDITQQYPAPESRFESGQVIPGWLMRMFNGAYVLPSQSYKDPLVSCLHFNPERHKFPNHVYLACGNADTLYTPVEKLAEKMKEVGVKDVDFRCVKYESHSFDKGAKVGTVSWERKNWMYQGVIDMVKKCVE